MIMFSFGILLTVIALVITTSLEFTVAYRYAVVVSNNSSLPRCKLTSGKYYCGSLNQAFILLNNIIKESVDVSIKPGDYSLLSSYNLTDLRDVKISSAQGSAPVIISCRQGNDGGIAFIRAKRLLLQYVSIRMCGMAHISSSQVFASKQFIHFRSALYFQNSTDLNMKNVKMYENNGIGMAIVDSNGMISIMHSKFSNNSLNPSEQAVNFTGGGGVYIEFTRCTPGLPNCDHSKNLYNFQANYFIEQCTFDVNSNNYVNSEPDQPASRDHITFGCGGGLSIWMLGNAHNNSFDISSNFSRNKANRGGGLCIGFRDSSAHSVISIFQSYLNDNVVSCNSGSALAAGASIGYAIYRFNERLEYNHVKLTKCNFIRNVALNGSGGGLGFYGSYESNVPNSTNSIEISQCKFEGNVAQFGSALDISKDYYETIPHGAVLTFIITNCSFISNNPNETMNGSYINKYNSLSRIGAITVTGFSVQFRSHSYISNHNSTALVLDNAIAEFYHGSLVIFSLNRGLKGGAMLLLQGSWLKLFSNVTLTFQNNTAIKSGGAIFAEMISPFDLLESHICFVRYYNSISSNKWDDVKIRFINNSNSTIFASTLHPCDREYGNAVDFFHNQPFSYSPPINKTNNTISTLPNKIHVLKDTLPVPPGISFELPVYLTDELNQSVTDFIFIVSCKSEIQVDHAPYVLPIYQYTNGLVQIAGKPTETCYLELQTDSNYQISAIITVPLLKCPPGYLYDDQAQKCDCIQASYELSGNPVIMHCNLSQFQAYVNPAYWVGYEGKNATVLMASPCPFGYCYGTNSSRRLFHSGIALKQNANKTLLDQHVCGAVSRTGRLCGKCIKNHSVAMNSPEFTCQKCKHHPFGIPLFIAYYIIPVTLLFYLIMTFNIRVTSGLFGAFLFFAQVIGSNKLFGFSYRINSATRSGEFIYPNFLVSLYNIFNLEFFQYDTFSYCLFANAGTVDILAFKLLASLYPLGLIIVYSLVRIYCRSNCVHQDHCLHHCHCLRPLCRFASKEVTSGLSAFLVLCFAKINVLAFSILKPVSVAQFDSDRKWRSNITVVYLQGSLEYLDSKHSLYVTGALIVLIPIIIIPTAFLLIHPLLLMLLGNLGMGESKLMRCFECCLRINKLIPLLGSFQGDYKNNMKFFAGLHFFLYKTIVLCGIIAIPTSSIGTSQLILIALFLVMFVVHLMTNPFRSQLNNIAYSMLYLLIIVLFGILYLFISDEEISFTTYLGVILCSLPLLCLVVYILSVLMHKTRLRFRHRGYINFNNLND